MHTPRLLFLAAAVTVVTPAFAASQRTFVASIGTDNPACSITAPCRSFAAAITATIQGGEVFVLDTVSRDNGDGGIALVAQNASIVLDHVRSEHNVNVGFYIAPVVPAIFAKATITDSLFANNGGNGIWADSVGSAVTTVMVERTTGDGQSRRRNPGDVGCCRFGRVPYGESQHIHREPDVRSSCVGHSARRRGP
jgi:hypothetical protein